jgi:DNA-directed RNA polymerase specialized sigma subunit
MTNEEKERFYLENKNLIHTSLKPYRNKLKKIEEQTGFTYEDLFQECSYYFLKLTDRFDPSKAKFSTFVVKSLNLYINTVIVKHSTIFNVPLDVKRNHFRILSKNLQEESVDEIALQMNISKSSAEKAKYLISSHLSLDSPAPSQNLFESEYMLIDYMQSDDFTDELLFQLLFEQFSETFLTDLERKTLSYLIEGYKTQEIAKIIGVSKTTVLNYMNNIDAKFRIMTQRCLFTFDIL